MNKEALRAAVTLCESIAAEQARLESELEALAEKRNAATRALKDAMGGADKIVLADGRELVPVVKTGRGGSDSSFVRGLTPSAPKAKKQPNIITL
jgi:hypothetical protein